MTLKYKGYLAKVEPDLEAGVFHGEVINTRDVITFQGETLKDLQKEFEASVEDYISYCLSRKEEPEKPFSGNFPVRTDPDTHRKLFEESIKKDMSMNSFVDFALKTYLSNHKT